MTKVKFSHMVPMLPVRDVQNTIQFYRDELSFGDLWTWGDPTTEFGLKRDEMAFIFSYDPQRNERSEGLEVMVFLFGVNQLWEELSGRNVQVTDPIDDKPWGTREFAIKDVNGYYLRFAQGLDLIDPE